MGVHAHSLQYLGGANHTKQKVDANQQLSAQKTNVTADDYFDMHAFCHTTVVQIIIFEISFEQRWYEFH